MRRTPGSGRRDNSPPANDSKVAGDRRVRRERPNDTERTARPFKSDKFGKSAKSKPGRFDRFAKPDKFGKSDKSYKSAEHAAVKPAGGPALRLTSNIYIAHTQPGFEAVAAEEIVARYAAASGRGRGPAMREPGGRVMPERAGMIIFSAPRPEPLARARTIEDLFTLAGYCDGLGTSPATLEEVRTVA